VVCTDRSASLSISTDDWMGNILKCLQKNRNVVRLWVRETIQVVSRSVSPKALWLKQTKCMDPGRQSCQPSGVLALSYALRPSLAVACAQAVP
jgi:hypothetical protein